MIAFLQFFLPKLCPNYISITHLCITDFIYLKIVSIRKKRNRIIAYQFLHLHKRMQFFNRDNFICK